MRDAIVLTEYGSAEVALEREDYQALRSRFAGRIDIFPTERRGVYRLAAREYAGRVSLPGGRLLVIEPKVGSRNLFYMLCWGVGAARFFPPPAGLSPNTEIFTFILAALVEKVERLMSKGLFTAFVSAAEDLPLVRGRILVGAQVARHADLKHKHVCAYADLTPDVPENRVLYAALRLMPALLRKGEDAALLHRVRSLLPRFAGVSILSRVEALAMFKVIATHRLNVEYGPALLLARLALQHLSLDEKAGPHMFASFLVDMPLLFESFVTEKLREGLRAHGLRVVAQRHDYLDEAKKVGIRPDVLIFGPGSRVPLLVLDAKYRNPNGEDGLSRDLYQVSAYLDRYGLQRGALVYPMFGEVSPGELKLRGTYKSLTLLALDLSVEEPGSLHQEIDSLARQVAALAQG